MNIRLQSDGVTLEFSSAQVVTSKAVTDGITFGCDAEGKIVAIGVRSRPWIDLAGMGTDMDRSTGAVMRYDPAVDALAIDVANSRYEESAEIWPGIIVDFDDRGDVVGLEFLDVRDRFSKDALAEIAKYAISGNPVFKNRERVSA